MNKVELSRWLAGHRPAPARVCAVDEKGAEHPISLTRGNHRWIRAANLLLELRAVSVRLYDGSGNLGGSCDIDGDDAPPPAAPLPQHSPIQLPPMQMQASPLASNQNELALLMGAFSEAIRSAIRDVSTTQAEAVRAVARDIAQTQAEAHKAAFQELKEVAKIAVERLVAVEQLAHEALERRQQDLDERERDVPGKGEEGLNAIVGPLMQAAGPEIVKRLLAADGPSNGAAK